MAAHVQSGGTNANNATSISRAFSINVTAGSLVVISASKFAPSTDAFIAGDCTKSAGTATIGTVQLDRQDGGDMGGTDGFGYTGHWSALVTGGGTLTMQVAGAVAGSYLLITTYEFSGSWDAARFDQANSQFSATNNQTSFSSNSITSTGAAVMVGGFQHNTSQAQTNTPDAAFTEVYSNETGTDDNGCFGYRIVGSSTTDAFDGAMTAAGLGSSGYVAAIVAYKEVAGGGSGLEIPRNIALIQAINRASNF